MTEGVRMKEILIATVAFALLVFISCCGNAVDTESVVEEVSTPMIVEEAPIIVEPVLVDDDEVMEEEILPQPSSSDTTTVESPDSLLVD